MLGSKQSPTVISDSPPSIPPTAARVCEAINVPAGLIAVCSLEMFGRAFGNSQATLGEAVFVVSIPLIWFLVALEIASLIRRDSNGIWDLLSGSFMLGIVIVVALFAAEERRQGEAIIASGAIGWCAVLGMFAAVTLVRFARMRVRGLNRSK
jgi:hypothetical protein